MGTGDASRPLVTGQIIIHTAVRTFDNAAVHVYLEDVSMADAAAEIVAETVIPAVRHVRAGGDTIVPFALDAGKQASIDTRRHYAVRVWVDCDNDGRPAHGDLYSDQVYPVLTRGFGDAVSIELEGSL